MTLEVIFIYLFITIAVISIAFLIGRGRIKLHKIEESLNQLEDVLDSAPDGYYFENYDQKEGYYCSRRLCLLLHIVNKKTSFTNILDTLDPEEIPQIKTYYHHLKENGTPFDINVSAKDSTFHFTLSGRLLYTPYNKHKSIIIWFKDTTEKTSLLIKERQSYIHIIKQREILTQTLNTLPIPLYVQDTYGQYCFANKAYNSDKEDDADIHWNKLPLQLEKNDAPHILNYGQDKTTEEGLLALLSDADRAHKMLLKELPYGILEFDSTGKLLYYNHAICDIWEIDTYFLKKEPTFEEILDKVQEKGLLPQVKDFAQYKKGQLKAFSELAKTSEDFLYLLGGKIVKRLMIPAAKGGILILDELK